MKYTLTFEIKLRVNRRALFDFVTGLDSLEIDPECLVWSTMAENTEVRVWMMAELEADRLEVITAYFGSSPFVTRTSIQPSRTILPPVYAGAAEANGSVIASVEPPAMGREPAARVGGAVHEP